MTPTPAQNSPFNQKVLENRLGTTNFTRRMHKEATLKPTTIHLPLLRAFLQLTGLYNKGIINARQFELTTHTFTFHNLPDAFDNFKILHLSDLHIDFSSQITPALCEALKKLPTYDLCVITGDFCTNHARNPALVLSNLQQITPCIQSPIYGVLGNHDKLDITPGLEALGIRMLLNETIQIQRNEDSLYIAGVDDPTYYQSFDLAKVNQAIPPNEFSILLAHSTNLYTQAKEYPFSLLLCGHTHGGQMCLPGNTPIFNQATAPRSFISGAWHYGSLQGYTSRGVGTCGLTARFNCPPEIALLTLKKT